MARSITPAQHLRTLRAAVKVAKAKGMHAEAAEAGRLADEVSKLLAEHDR